MIRCSGRDELTDANTTFGYLFRSDRVLVIYNVDWFPPFDPALVFLHELRHARQRFGERFAGLPPLDPDDVHEARTWLFHSQLFRAVGGILWADTVRWLADELQPSYAHEAVSWRARG